MILCAFPVVYTKEQSGRHPTFIFLLKFQKNLYISEHSIGILLYVPSENNYRFFSERKAQKKQDRILSS
jgi:hypothetical protein